MRSMKNVAVFTEDGAFALFFRPHPGGFDSSRVPTPGNLPSKAKKILMPGGQPGGALGAAGIDWCISIDNIILGPVRSEISADNRPKWIEEFSCSSQYIHISKDFKEKWFCCLILLQTELFLLGPTINTQRMERENKRTDKLIGKSGNAPGCNGKENAKFGRGQIDALIWSGSLLSHTFVFVSDFWRTGRGVGRYSHKWAI